MAIDVFGRGTSLEPGRRWHAGVLNQPASCALLHAGSDHDGNPWSRCLIWCLWHVGDWSYVVCLRGLTRPENWRDEWLKISFWSFNIGLAMMTFLSLLPQGLWQTYLSYTEGYWYARSAEVIHSPLMENLVWARVPGDIVFSFGVLALMIFIWRLYFPGKQQPVVQEN